MSGKIPDDQIGSKARLFAERNFEISDIENLFPSSTTASVEKTADCGCKKNKKQQEEQDVYSKVKLVSAPSTIKTASSVGVENEGLSEKEIYKNLNLNLARAILGDD